MGLRFFDPMVTYGSVASLGAGGFTVGTPGDVVVSATGGRSGGGYAAIADSGVLGIPTNSSDVTQRLWVSFSFWAEAVPGDSNTPLVRIYNGGGTQLMAAVHLTSGQGFEVRDSNDSVVGMSADALWNPAGWEHLEIEVEGDGALGRVRVLLGDVEVLEVVDIDTDATGGGSPDFVTMHRGVDAGGSATRFDDIATWDSVSAGSGDPFVQSVGDFFMEHRFPTGDVESNSWAHSGGGGFYEDVDDSLGDHDDDSTYVESVPGGPGDLVFSHAGGLVADTVLAVGVLVEGRRTQQGNISIDVEALVRGDLTNDDGGTTDEAPIPVDIDLNLVPDQYVVTRHALYEDPAENAAWTQNGVNDMGFGLRG